MACDQVVSPQDVLRAVMQLRRQGVDSVMKELEDTEPDLAEFLLEETSSVHRQLLELGAMPRRVARLHRRVLSLSLVLVLALRQARLRLWHEPDPLPSSPPVPPPEGEIPSQSEDLPSAEDTGPAGAADEAL